MKITCLQENLARGLATVGRAVASRSTLPVLSNILLESDEGRLRLAATNLEIGVSCWIGARVEEEGRTTVPARLLTEFVNSLPPGQIEMELSERTQTLNLKCARYEANIKGIDASEFPLVPTADTIAAQGAGHRLHLQGENFRRMIDQAVFAAATDESRPILTGVLAQFHQGGLTLAAADGFRLAVTSADVGADLDEVTSVIIPARALSELARISTGEEETIELIITPGRNQILFHLPNTDLVSQLIEGNFPDYKQIVPKSYSTRTVVNTQDLLKAVKVAFLFARDAANIIRFNAVPGSELTPGQMIVTATSAEFGDNVSEIDASIQGDETEIAFNARYMIDALNVVGTPEVAVETSTSSSPGVLRPVGGDDFLCVIMPMHITR
ncbi:MAG: DNA polymerase III subunit beta [Anaerolineaceae bacterium]|jgi:DNA polymerase-3 subunit beta|nr:DNA polymerase III subunit beta [Anaerolineae bacterium]MDX9829423.1 DNA polymerase III subunit beta [Anaerolineae bacterium]NLF13811.1 DNA polymerase III subunit beta [Anaerolineaceae bacterium]